MFEIEQFFLEMLASLKQSPSFTPWQKYQIATRLEDRAAKAAQEFLEEDARRMEKEDAA